MLPVFLFGPRVISEQKYEKYFLVAVKIFFNFWGARLLANAFKCISIHPNYLVKYENKYCQFFLKVFCALRVKIWLDCFKNLIIQNTTLILLTTDIL